MTRCPENDRLQQLLDGELSAGDEAALRAHALGCAECREELALYEQVFAALDTTPLLEPSPFLTERILARVLPSQVRRRWMKVLGVGYGVAAAGSVAGVTALMLMPASRSLIAGIAAQASHRLAQAAIFVLDSLAFAAVQMAGGWNAVLVTASRFSPIGRAIGTLLSRPGVEVILLTAMVASGLLIWWLRPRDAAVRRARNREIGHVGLLGF